jgi:8-oxo-dGTP diphosphatase
VGKEESGQVYRFCPYCGGNLTKDLQFYLCVKCGKKVYINSKPAAGVVVVKNKKFLITKRAHGPKEGYYDVIGGFLNSGEHPEEGAIRETKEETNLDIIITDLLGIYVDNIYHYQGEKIPVLIILYIAEIVGGKINPQDDVASLHWVDINKPPKKLAFAWLAGAMKDLQREYGE